MATLRRLHKRIRILLVGDFIVDIHHFGVGQGVSVEAPVPVGRNVKTVVSPGGAGLVARNLGVLGADATFVFAADPNFSKKFPDLLASPAVGVVRTKPFVEPRRVVTVKERFLIDNKKVLRWNHEDSKPLLRQTERSLMDWFVAAWSRADLVIVSDYRHGLLSRRLAGQLVAAARRANLPLWVDSQLRQGEDDREANHHWYRGASLVCLNQAEALAIDSSFDSRQIQASLARISKKLAVPSVVIKLGREGSAALVDGRFIRTPGYCVKAIDAVGAGDAFLAALAVASGGQTVSESALEKANRWAALATTVAGTELPPSRAAQNIFLS